MRIRIGYEIGFDCAAETPMVLMLRVRPERQGDLEQPDAPIVSASRPTRDYRDGFGNICTRVVAPAGPFSITLDTVIADSGDRDRVNPEARQIPVQDLPDDALVYLLPSRYCETDRLNDIAWSLFAGTAPGWARVQAIVDYVHERITFGYPHARATRTAFDGHEERIGVCRDFAHLAVTLCRCMNIPARYCTGYLGDIGVPKDPAPMDFSAWFEVLLHDGWYTFDARHNHPRIGRVVMARGRDAADVALTTNFGSARLVNFVVRTDELIAERVAVPA